VFIGDPGSEIAAMIRVHRAGAVVREGDGDALAAAIRHYQSRPQAAADAGAAARQLWRQRYRREAEIARWERLLADLLERGEGNLP
jgi:colanic acid biosynthesis glycosyl transferase WcaI